MERIGISEKPKIVDLTKKDMTAETLTEARITCSVEDKVSRAINILSLNKNLLKHFNGQPF